MRVSGMILPLCSLYFAYRLWVSIPAIKRGFSGPKPLSSQAMQPLLIHLAADVTIVFILVALGIWMFRRSSKKTVALPEADESKAVGPHPAPSSVETLPRTSRPNAGIPATCFKSARRAQLWQFDAQGALR